MAANVESSSRHEGAVGNEWCALSVDLDGVDVDTSPHTH